MTRLGISLAACAALAATPAAPASAGDEPAFEGQGPWAIDYGEQSCRLARNFSDGDDTITLAFERFLPGPGMRLGIAGDRRKVAPSTKTVRFRYGPDGEEREQQVYLTVLADGRSSFLIRSASLLGELPQDYSPQDSAGTPFSFQAEEELAAAEKVDSVVFSKGVTGRPLVRLGPMKEPVRALQACVADLMKGWGLDMDRMVRMTRLPEPESPPQSWMSTKDYPPEMLWVWKTGVVGFRLVVDEDGKVASCHVDLDTPGPFGLATCKAISEHARFKPGLDAEGKPMRSLYVNSVRFQLCCALPRRG